MHESQEIAIVYTQRNELSIVKFAHITTATGTRYIQGLEVTVPCVAKDIHVTKGSVRRHCRPRRHYHWIWLLAILYL